MNPKWLGFLIFVWLIGVFIGGTYEADMGTELTAGKAKMEYLFTPVETNYEGTIGETKWWAASPNYWITWLEVLVWDFPFCKPYDVDNSGVIEVDERHNNDFGVYAGYFLKAFGIVGLAAVLFAMFEFFQGFLPWS